MTQRPQPQPMLAEHIKQLERMRRDFIANVSHELRTPLTVIQGYLEVLLQNPTPEAAALDKMVEQMYQHSCRMSDTIADLLLLSSLEHDEHTPPPAKRINLSQLLVDLKPEIHSINDSLGSQHQIIFNIDKALYIAGRSNEIKSLISNLATNAMKYTAAQGKITISCTKHDDHINLSVADNGIGIAAKHMKRLTERFYRVDKARSRQSGGTGLGLSIVKHILIRHQAELEIVSKPGQGSLFRCQFPLI